jgi:hypothetical protein
MGGGEPGGAADVPIDDIDGTWRPHGAAADVGAYESP